MLMALLMNTSRDCWKYGVEPFAAVQVTAHVGTVRARGLRETNLFLLLVTANTHPRDVPKPDPPCSRRDEHFTSLK
jgi:hypothetical protein